jgi:hypothetical protein
MHDESASEKESSQRVVDPEIAREMLLGDP